MSDHELFDETALRRALRLDADEVGPAVSLPHLARAERRRSALHAAEWLLGGAAFALGLPALAALVASAAPFTGSLAADLLDGLIAGAVGPATQAALALDLVFPSASTVALVAAAVLLIAATERGVHDVEASRA